MLAIIARGAGAPQPKSLRAEGKIRFLPPEPKGGNALRLPRFSSTRFIFGDFLELRGPCAPRAVTLRSASPDVFDARRPRKFETRPAFGASPLCAKSKAAEAFKGGDRFFPQIRHVGRQSLELTVAPQTLGSFYTFRATLRLLIRRRAKAAEYRSDFLDSTYQRYLRRKRNRLADRQPILTRATERQTPPANRSRTMRTPRPNECASSAFLKGI